MNQLSIYKGIISDNFCEICHEKGHKSWACTNKSRKAEVKCEICGERSHPTVDCPQKANYQKPVDMNKEFARFMYDVEGEKANNLLEIGKNDG